MAKIPKLLSIKIKTSLILSHLDQNGYHQENKLGHPQATHAVLLRWGRAGHRPAWALKVVACGKTLTGTLSTFWCQEGGYHHDEPMCGEEMGEKEKQNGPCAEGKDRKEEMKAVWSRQM